MLFEVFMREIADAHPKVTIVEALGMVEDVESGKWSIESFRKNMEYKKALNAKKAALPSWVSMSNPFSYAVWAYKNCPEAVTNLKNDKMLSAIKAMRDMTGAGLKESKDAAEVLKFVILEHGASNHPLVVQFGSAWESYKMENPQFESDLFG